MDPGDVIYAANERGSAVHDTSEVDRALDALAADDLLALHAAARAWIRGFRLDPVVTESDDLVAEAIARTVSGRRSWKKGVDFVFHLTQVMRSVASSWRKSAARREAAGAIEIRESELLAPGEAGDAPDSFDDPSGPLGFHPSPEPDAERAILAKRRVEAWLEDLRGDPEATAVLDGWYLGLSGPEIQQRSGMSRKQYLAAVRRIQRRAERERDGHGH